MTREEVVKLFSDKLSLSIAEIEDKLSLLVDAILHIHNSAVRVERQAIKREIEGLPISPPHGYSAENSVWFTRRAILEAIDGRSKRFVMPSSDPLPGQVLGWVYPPKAKVEKEKPSSPRS